MSLIPCFLLFLGALPGERIDVSEAYALLTRDNSVLAGNGHIYLLDMQAAKIRRLDAEGKQVSAFSQKGQGPGELTQPVALVLQGDYLYVADLGRGMVRFDLDGNFVQMYKCFGFHQKIRKGWLVTDLFFDVEAETRLVATDENLEHPVTLLHLGPGKQPMDVMVTEDKVVISYNPAMNRAHLVVDPSGDVAFCYNPVTATISVIDGRTRTISREIKIPGKAIPFNKDWGRIKVKELEENVLLDGRKVLPEITTRMPDTFPLVAAIQVGPNGLLWVASGLFLMNPEQAPYLVFDREGKQHRAPFSFLEVMRILGIRNGQAYVLCYDRAKEAPFIQRCPTGEVRAVVAEVSNDAGVSGAPLSIFSQ